MARRDLRHPAGVDGPWFVDDRCIDCDAARQVAPGLIARNPGDGVSVFTRQPETDDEVATGRAARLLRVGDGADTEREGRNARWCHPATRAITVISIAD